VNDSRRPSHIWWDYLICILNLALQMAACRHGGLWGHSVLASFWTRLTMSTMRKLPALRHTKLLSTTVSDVPCSSDSGHERPWRNYLQFLFQLDPAQSDLIWATIPAACRPKTWLGTKKRGCKEKNGSCSWACQGVWDEKGRVQGCISELRRGVSRRFRESCVRAKLTVCTHSDAQKAGRVSAFRH